MMTSFKPILMTTYRLLLLLLGSILFLDGLILILNGKIHIGIVIPLLIGLALLLYAIFFQSLHQQLQQKPILKKLWHVGCITFAVWLMSFLVFAWILQQQIKQHPDVHRVEAIIVLGSGIKNGQPSAALAKRLDTAASFYQQYPNAIIVLSGGVDFGERDSEAKIMARYLENQYGISPFNMLLEDKSTSTQLNLKNSKVLLQQHSRELHQPIAIVTSDFHTVRAAAIAKKEGYSNIVMISAPTPLSIRYNAWLREYFAFILGKVLNEY